MRNWTGKTMFAAGMLALGVAASEGDVNYRQHTMAAVGGHMQAIVDIIRRDVPHTSHLATHANALADLAAIAPALFPADSEGGDALPAIWTDAEDFKAKLDGFKEAADAMKAAAASGDAAQVGGALGQLGQACKACHDNYRAQ